MADTRAATEAFPDLDSLIDRELIFKWLYWGLFWLMFTPSIGVTISSLFNYPDYLGTSEYLTFGRLRPMHVNGVIFGAFSTLFIGLCYYLLPRLSGVRVWNGHWGHWLVWVWNLGLIAGMASLFLGYNQGLEAGEFPLLIDTMIFVVVTVVTVQFLVTIAQRHEPQLYVAVWYLIGAFVWTVLNLMLGSFILPYYVHRHQQRRVPWPVHPLHRRAVDHAGGLRADLLLPAGEREQPGLQPQAVAGRLLVAGAVLSVRRHPPLPVQPDRRLGRDAWPSSRRCC